MLAERKAGSCQPAGAERPPGNFHSQDASARALASPPTLPARRAPLLLLPRALSRGPTTGCRRVLAAPSAHLPPRERSSDEGHRMCRSPLELHGRARLLAEEPRDAGAKGHDGDEDT